MVGETLTPVTGTLTVIAVVAVKPPSAVVAVMVADPAALAVTTPPAVTEATPDALELQVTVLLVAFSGDTVAVIVCV